MTPKRWCRWIGNEIATNTGTDRSGMIVVRQLPTGEHFMSYEVCGDPLTGHKCAAHCAPREVAGIS
jgi:hypothetical protein